VVGVERGGALTGRTRALIAGLLVLALAAGSWAALLFLSSRQLAAERSGALLAARQYAVDLTTYDFSTIDADFARFARHGTAAFRKTYAATIAASEPAVVQAQSRALGTVVGAGLESLSGGRASVLLAVDQEIRSSRKPGVTTSRSRIRMSLVRSGDGWLVTGVRVL
jgi:Mce-associated membrane protein